MTGDQDKVCGSSLTLFPQEIPAAPENYGQAARACVERWSARLARGSDPLNIIADAVVATCHQEIERLVDGKIVSYDRIKALNPEVRAYWHGHAMFIGAQVRAANCYRDA